MCGRVVERGCCRELAGRCLMMEREGLGDVVCMYLGDEVGFVPFLLPFVCGSFVVILEFDGVRKRT